MECLGRSQRFSAKLMRSLSVEATTKMLPVVGAGLHFQAESGDISPKSAAIPASL